MDNSVSVVVSSYEKIDAATPKPASPIVLRAVGRGGVRVTIDGNSVDVLTRKLAQAVSTIATGQR